MRAISPKTIARVQAAQQILLCIPELEHLSLARFQHEHGLRLVVLSEEKLPCGHIYHGGRFEYEIEYVGTDPAKDRHALQRGYPRLLHGYHRLDPSR